MKEVCPSHAFRLFEGPPGLLSRRCAGAAALVVALAMSGCASRPDAQRAEQGAGSGASLRDDDADSGSGRITGVQSGNSLGSQPGQDLATRHALFKVSAFDALPGWQQDNVNEAWVAFRESCKALEKKPSWKPLCAEVRRIKDPKAGRAFIEREFALLTVQNTDRSREGEITGYYEPLLLGRTQRDARFNVPVYGVPNDLYILDWKNIPAAQRKGIAYVKPSGRQLVAAQAGQPGALRIELRRFTLDTLDRRLRVRIQGDEALPYYNRAEIAQRTSMDAPVLAWVDDAVALYAMQVQGAGRIRLPDGSVLRLQFADQNGHPFKPMQLAAQGNERVQTRGGANGVGVSGEEDPDIEHFELAELAAPAQEDATAGMDDPVTRGGRSRAGTAQAGTATSASAADGDVAAAVDALTPRPAAASARAASSGSGPANAASTRQVRSPAAPAPVAGSNQLVNDLLTQAAGKPGARQPASSTSPTASSKGTGKTLSAAVLAGGGRPQTASGTGTTAAAEQLSARLLAQRQRALDSDPSYVFFRVATDQSGEGGPVGALGVPLTAGRSLAVDPRVMPLGYPVFLDAAPGGKREPHMQRLMFAQDTGGAIRGAVRADYFWGFGSDAGKQARRTKQRGRMWVMVPHAEVQALLSSKLVTRGAGAAAQSDCLIQDEAFCLDPADEASLP